MKSITIHGLDDSLALKLSQKAKQDGLSLNRTVKSILAAALGLRPNKHNPKVGRFDEFCGVWTQQDLAEFEMAAEQGNRIDPGDWDGSQDSRK